MSDGKKGFSIITVLIILFLPFILIEHFYRTIFDKKLSTRERMENTMMSIPSLFLTFCLIVIGVLSVVAFTYAVFVTDGGFLIALFCLPVIIGFISSLFNNK